MNDGLFNSWKSDWYSDWLIDNLNYNGWVILWMIGGLNNHLNIRMIDWIKTVPLIYTNKRNDLQTDWMVDRMQDWKSKY